MRWFARHSKDSPAEAALTETQIEVLRYLRPKLPPMFSAYEAMRAVATLCGFLARKHDGEPG